MRRAERLAAAQAEQIGIAQADLYPAFSISGTLGYQAKNFPDLLSPGSLNGNVGPSFQWNILNYGRIINNVRLQDAKFQELVTTYQDTVLRASEEAEDGLVTFLRAKRRAEHLGLSAQAAKDALAEMFDVLAKFGGRPGMEVNRYSVIEQNRVQQDDLLAQVRGEIALGLIQVYRALGGGWEIRLEALPVEPLRTEVVPKGGPEGAEVLEKLEQLLKPEPGAAAPVMPEPPAAPAKR